MYWLTIKELPFIFNTFLTNSWDEEMILEWGQPGSKGYLIITTTKGSYMKGLKPAYGFYLEEDLRKLEEGVMYLINYIHFLLFFKF